MNSEQGFQLADLGRIVRKRAMLVGSVTGGALLLAILVSSWWPNEYESSAIMLIEPQTINTDLVESNLQQTNLNDRLHLIQMQILSRSRLSDIIDKLNVYPEESKEMTREEIIELMREKIAVKPLLSELEAQAGIRSNNVQINTFELAFRHQNPVMAAEVANRIGRSFVEEHLKDRTRQSSDTSQFIEAELAELGNQIGEVERQIAEVKTANTGRLPEDLPANQRLHERLIQQMRDVKRDLAMAQSDEAFYRSQVDSGFSSDVFRYNSGVMTPERRLEGLRLLLNEYNSRGFTEKHPDMIQTRAEIAELEAQANKPSEPGSNEPLSIAQQTAKAEQQRAALRLRSAQDEFERLKEQLTDIEGRLAATPRVQGLLHSLERQWEHLSSSYQEFSGKQLEASVAADMERRQKGEKFRVLEEAVPAEEVASPNRPAIVALALVFGLGLAVGLAFLLEATDRSFHSVSSLQAKLGIPVLAAVPKIQLASDLALERRRKLRHTLAAVTLTGAVLALSLVGNWYVNSGSPGAGAVPAAQERAAGGR